MRRVRRAALCLALTALPLAAAAAPACDVSLSMVDFGRVRYKEGSDITGQLSVTCDGPTAFAVSASPGYGSYDMRTMLGPKGAVLRYNLYVDAARRRVWGDGEAGTALGIDAGGRLEVAIAGERRLVESGEVLVAAYQ